MDLPAYFVEILKYWAASNAMVCISAYLLTHIVAEVWHSSKLRFIRKLEEGRYGKSSQSSEAD
jgi:hypothetical protein